jgi:hypothetical protein
LLQRDEYINSISVYLWEPKEHNEKRNIKKFCWRIC